jgi:hypothetical protein
MEHGAWSSEVEMVNFVSLVKDTGTSLPAETACRRGEMGKSRRQNGQALNVLEIGPDSYRDLNL